ncbi:MAG: ATP-binding protein [Alphaproteobacteria bacterium]
MKAPDTQIFHYVLKDMESVYELSEVLAKHFPRPQQYTLAIYELLINAVEHGNLEIGFESKTKLLREGALREEIARRLAMPHYAARQVHVKVERSIKACSLMIIDDGKGFTWEKFLNREPDVALPNGRGLHIAQCAVFDAMEFNKTGNAVLCEVRK